MRGKTKRSLARHGEDRRRFLLLHAAALLTAAAGSLTGGVGPRRDRGSLKGREARYYRKLHRERKE